MRSPCQTSSASPSPWSNSWRRRRSDAKEGFEDYHSSLQNLFILFDHISYSMQRRKELRTNHDLSIFKTQAPQSFFSCQYLKEYSLGWFAVTDETQDFL